MGNLMLTWLMGCGRLGSRWNAVTLLVLLAAPLASASALRETSDFAEVAAVVGEYADKFGAENVLLVCDLDNTLLAMEQELGSDQWFQWQSHLLATEPKSPQLTAPDFPGLLRVQGMLFDVQPMRPTQPDLPLLLGRIQGMGASTIVLTARGHDFRGATEFELRRHGFDFSSNAIELSHAADGEGASSTEVFLPYRRDALEEAGITEDEFLRWRLKERPDAVSYGRGVFMVAGQHKGAMLAALLKRASQSFRAIVYVDQDLQIRRVFDAMFQRDYQVTVFDYQREEGRVKAFQYGDKADVIRQWSRIKTAFEVETNAVDDRHAIDAATR